MRDEAGLLGTPGDGWDVGWAVGFLASDEARWITGVTLPVDVRRARASTPLLMARPPAGRSPSRSGQLTRAYS